jgi:hypothetical protein
MNIQSFEGSDMKSSDSYQHKPIPEIILFLDIKCSNDDEIML